MPQDQLFDDITTIIRILSAHMRKLESEQNWQNIDQALDELLKTLANSSRRKMLDVIAREEQWITSIVEKLHEHPQTIKRHLHELERVDLVQPFPKREKIDRGRGRPRIYYKLNESLEEFMVCSILHWDDTTEMFPELRLLQCQLATSQSPKELKQIAQRALSLSKAFQNAGEKCLELVKLAEDRIKKPKMRVRKIKLV